jgi:hypothetical protein
MGANALVKGRTRLGIERGLLDHELRDSVAVAQRDERDRSEWAHGVDPTAEHDALSIVLVTPELTTRVRAKRAGRDRTGE